MGERGVIHVGRLWDAQKETHFCVLAARGFSPEEAQQITAIGAWPVSLGKRILRGETAAIALTALAAYEMGC